MTITATHDAATRFHWGDALTKAVQIWFPDGSNCQIHATDLAILAAEQVALPNVRVGAHLREQILPIFNGMPSAMVSIARGMGWQNVRPHVQNATLRAPDDYFEEIWPVAALAVVPSELVAIPAPAWMH